MSVIVEFYTFCYNNYVNGKIAIFTTENLNFSGWLHQGSVNAQNRVFCCFFFFYCAATFFFCQHI